MKSVKTCILIVLFLFTAIHLHAWPWPDTGQTKCYNDTTEILCPSPGEPFYGQDAQYQGPARSYTKLGQNGAVLSNTATYSDGWVMTKDNVTGLIWEMKTDDGTIHDKDWTFSWCDTNLTTNGGNQGTCNYYWDTETFIKALNNSNYGGFSDWRMPTIKELSSLINSSISSPGPLIDAAWFPNTEYWRLYWSSTSQAEFTNLAWCVDFGWGDVPALTKSNDFFARAVRGDGFDTATLVDNGNGTVTDTTTGLMWQKTTAPGFYNWQQALAYADTLNLAGYTDWRLPSRNEMLSLVDYSRTRKAIDLLLDPDTGGSFYWTSTNREHTANSTANSTAEWAWPWDAFYGNFGVGYGDKSDYFYVRTVRGPTRLHHFEFSTISSPQAVGTPFGVTITAKDAYGETLTKLNGTILLWSSAGSMSVYPGTVRLVNGQWTGSVTVYSAGDGMNLIAGNTYNSGTSNDFNIIGMSSMYGNLSGKIKDRKGDQVLGSIKIVLEGSQNYSLTTLQSTYQFPLNQIICGNYTAHAEYGVIISPNYTVNVPCNNQNVTHDFMLPMACSNTAGKTPVLLLAGMMGSATRESVSLYPVLPKTAPAWDSEELYLLAPKTVGWKKLIEKLTEERYEEGCTLFKVPYDWRMDSRDVAGKYLKPWIDEAKKSSPTGKVDIIAHSMGGLVARAYIQGMARDEKGESITYGNDIARFAMVGTPNEGSSKAYYLWEGGDPELLDDILPDPISLFFYWNVTQVNYEEAFPDSDSLKPYHWDKIWKYYTGGKPKGDEENNAMFGLKNLLPTYAFLRKNLGKDEPTPLTEVTNDFLTMLNNSAGKFRMGDGSNPNKIKTAVFVGKNANEKNTINELKVGKSSGTTRFMDGQLSITEGKGAGYHTDIDVKPYYDYGDGTVLQHSAELPATEGWAMPAVTQEECSEHSSLIGCFTDNNGNYLVKFLKDEPLTAPSATAAGKSLASAEPTDKTLAISTKGRVQAYLVNPSGLGLGINIATGLAEESIVNGSFGLKPDRGSLAVQEPVDGTYTLYIQGFYEENFDLTISYMDSLTSKVIKSKGFNHANTFSFTFSLDSASDDKITVNHSPTPPTGLQADAVNNGGLKTRLTWTVSSEQNVTGYNIYSKYDDEPYFSQLGSTAGNTFDTNHPWAESASVKTRIYAVAAVKAGGAESFLSNMVDNNDRDHDGLNDEQETTLGTNLVLADTDGDGLTDGSEILRGTNPKLKDTDGDGYWDQAEIQAGSDPLDSQSTPVGTATIDARPDALNATAPWTLTGPYSYSHPGTGDKTLNNLPIGDYTITWEAVTGWTPPTPATLAITSGGTTNFNGTYVRQTGTAIINPDPNSINAPWTLTGPESYSQTGNGDRDLGNLPIGNYMITWGAVTGWNAPAGQTKAVTNGGTTTFIGTYVQKSPIIQVTPLSLNFIYNPRGSRNNLLVKNTGVGILTGNATTDTPFIIVSGGSYSLSADESQIVTIEYRPTSPGPHAGTVVFTGGNGATIPVTGKTEKSQGLPWLQLLLGD